MLSSDNRTALPFVIYRVKMEIDTKIDPYKKLYNKVLASKKLNDQEKLMLTCILAFADADKGFCFSNKEFLFLQKPHSYRKMG